jgi:DNA polymerase-3 subunit beta
MDLTVDQAALSRALRLVARVAPVRPTLPILQMVLLDAEPGWLRLTATDAELAMTTAVPADVANPGRVAIPARLLGEYVAQLPAEPVRLALDPARQRVRAGCGSFVATLATADPDEFPALPAADERSAHDLDAGRLRRALERVACAAARDESRPVLSGVLFDFGAEGLTLAAADGFRLARTRLPEAAAAPQQLLVPARAVAEFARLLADAQAARLLLTPDGRGVWLAAGETALYARLIEGRFPEIERVIPQECRTRVTVETVALRQAVRVAGLFSSGDVRPVLLEAMHDRLRVTARGAETGEAESALSASLEGDLQAVSLNTRLLADLLDAVAADRLELRWTSPQAPVVVREASPADEADLAVVMPLHDPALAQRPAEAA